MTNRVPEKTWLFLAFVFTFIVYWPSLQGFPIWDDLTFWFDDPGLKNGVTYQTIWGHYSWPLSVTLQKFLLGLFGERYLYYHLLSVTIHFINALIIFKIGKLLEIKQAILLFLLFLFHPTAVISTAWMIQLKTLICFTFGFGAILILLAKGFGLSWLILSSILFMGSVASKSASLPLAAVFIFLIFRQAGLKRTHLWLPFLLVTLFGGYRLFKSPVTMEGVLQAKEQIKISPVEKNQDSFTFGHDLVLQTMNYYFWQSLVPVDLSPVKGTNQRSAGVLDYVHLFFLFALTIILWRDRGIYYLIFSYILLLPFLGLIPAPYMNITWVSDQHLYMALPLLLAFWIRLLEKTKIKHLLVIPVFFVVVFIYTSWKTTPYYRDSISFYEKSLETNPFNVPIIYNLAMDRIYRGEKDKAFELLEKSYELAQYESSMKKNVYFPYLVQLYLQMRQKREKDEN